MIVPVNISPELKHVNPATKLGIVESKVTNSDHDPDLWRRISDETLRIRTSLSFEDIKDISEIAATRKMYALCGKDPSRYRPSAEALMRRIVKGQDLYRINTLVDIINFISLQSGFSIGGFNADLINGSVEAGIGRAGEIYHAIGRGLMNIENLPVLRDQTGAIGSPTSDEDRTSIRPETTHMLMVFYAFETTDHLQPAMDSAVQLLKLYAGAELILFEIV